MGENEKGKQVNRGGEEEEAGQQQIWSWGAGTEGQLGTGRLEDERLPHLLRIPSLVSAGPIFTLACGGAHVIALTSGGRVLTWGRGTSGQLGHGDMVNSLHPKPVKSLESHCITHVSAGWSHSGFVSDTGCLLTCGDGTFGQLGLGENSSYRIPMKVTYFSVKHVEQIACGMRHSLVLLKGSSGKQVYGFGSGKRGQLGISRDKIRSVNLPEVTCGFEDIEIVSISASGDHSAALTADGHLYTWGRGFTGTSDVNSPVRLLSSLQFTEVALGWNHALVLTGDREVYMLGGNHHGVLGDLEKMNTVKQFSASVEDPVDRVSSLAGVKVVQIAAGAEHSAIVTVDGAIKTWGWGEHGQLGLENTSDQTNPQEVCLGHEVQKEDILKVFCGSGFTFAVRSPSLDRRIS